MNVHDVVNVVRTVSGYRARATNWSPDSGLVVVATPWELSSIEEAEVRDLVPKGAELRLVVDPQMRE